MISTPGVVHLLGKGTTDPVPCVEIERIRAAVADGCSLEPHPRIAKGIHVRIRRGIFAGTEGMVTELRHNCKVVLALSGVDQCFSLEARMGDMEAIND